MSEKYLVFPSNGPRSGSLTTMLRVLGREARKSKGEGRRCAWGAELVYVGGGEGGGCGSVQKTRVIEQPSTKALKKPSIWTPLKGFGDAAAKGGREV